MSEPDAASTVPLNKKSSAAAATVAEGMNILMLQETVRNLEESKVRLLLTIKDLKEKLEQQKADQADIYYYLNKKCDEGFEIIASLEEQLSSEQSDREIAEKIYENRIEEQRVNLLNMESRTGSRIAELESKVEMLSGYGQAKEEMERSLAQLQSSLDSERLAFRQATEGMENKFLVEREKLRRAYEIKYESLKKELEGSIDGKLAKKTQRTQVLNMVMKKELEAQSRHADRLLEINAGVIERDKKLKLELELAEAMRDELLAKSATSTRQVKDMEKRLTAIEEQASIKAEQDRAALEAKENEVSELKLALAKERMRGNRAAAKTDEVWLFLGRAHQLLLRSNQKEGFTTTNVKSNALGNSVALSEEEQQADFHQRMLQELFQHLAMKFPDFVQRLLADRQFTPQLQQQQAVTTNQQQQSLVAEEKDTGIFSWRTERAADRRPQRQHVPTKNTAVQTDYMHAMIGEAAWGNGGSVLSPPQPQQQVGSLWSSQQMSSTKMVDGSSMDSASIAGVFSLPTIVGRGNNNNNNNPYSLMQPQPPGQGSSIMSTSNDDNAAGNSLRTLSLPGRKQQYNNNSSRHPGRPKLSGGRSVRLRDSNKAVDYLMLGVGGGSSGVLGGNGEEWSESVYSTPGNTQSLLAASLFSGNSSLISSSGNQLQLGQPGFGRLRGPPPFVLDDPMMDLAVAGRKFRDPTVGILQQQQQIQVQLPRLPL